VTGELGLGYVGSFARLHPWVTWARHEVGGRLVMTMNRSTDDARDWSMTIGLEVEPLGLLQAAYDKLKAR
jgi:hypothetical protein